MFCYIPYFFIIYLIHLVNFFVVVAMFNMFFSCHTQFWHQPFNQVANLNWNIIFQSLLHIQIRHACITLLICGASLGVRPFYSRFRCLTLPTQKERKKEKILLCSDTNRVPLDLWRIYQIWCSRPLNHLGSPMKEKSTLKYKSC